MGERNNKRDKTMKIILVIALTLAIAPIAYAGAIFGQKLAGYDAQTQTGFGSSVAVDGDVCVIGAYYDKVSGVRTGSAYVFRYVDPNWVQEAKLIAPDGSPNDWFGYSVSLDGDVCVIGAYYDKVSGVRTGSAYVFRYVDPNWVLEAKLVASDGASNDFFGESVSIDGDVCVIGAYDDEVNGVRTGSAYIFRYVDPNWIQEAKLIAFDRIESSWFGDSVATNGDVCIVGAPGDDDNGSYSGSAYVFQFTDPNWVFDAKLTASDASSDDQFGYSVAIDGDTCVIGAIWNFIGSAYIFRYAEPNWVQEAKLAPADGWEFGSSVSISSDTCVIGAPLGLASTKQAGSAYVYRYKADEWLLDARLIPYDEKNGDEFGTSVSIDGVNVTVGAIYSGAAGAAYTYRICPTGDLSGDCFVSLEDVFELAAQWLSGWHLSQ